MDSSLRSEWQLKYQNGNWNIRMTQKIKPISQTSKQQHSLDSYGYPFPPGSRQRLRNTTIRTSKSILNICIYLLMSFLGGLFWLGRIGKKYPIFLLYTYLFTGRTRGLPHRLCSFRVWRILPQPNAGYGSTGHGRVKPCSFLFMWMEEYDWWGETTDHGFRLWKKVYSPGALWLRIGDEVGRQDGERRRLQMGGRRRKMT